METNSSSSDNPSIHPATNSPTTRTPIAAITRVRPTPTVWAPIEYTATTDPRNAAPEMPTNSAVVSAATTRSPAARVWVRRQ